MAIFVLLSNSKMTHIPKDKILILDGATGTMIQRYGLSEADYRDGVFEKSKVELHGNSECLNLTRPEIIRSIHREYIEAGADIIETNTFSANRISQAEYGCEDYAARMAYEGARLAREVADEYLKQGGRRILVAGSMGPTSKSLSLSPDVSDPGFRPYSFDQMREAYREQAQALLEGGADLLLIETCFDALNVKAALAAIQECNAGLRNESTGNLQGDIPVMISVSVSDRSGRTLTGQTLKAFYTAVSHYPLLSFGLNCSLGAAEMTPLVEEISQWCDCAVSCYPNAGLPNEMGGYDQSPEDMAQAVRTMAAKGLLNIAGGCCGTTPDHIRAIATALTGIAPRPVHSSESVSGSPHPHDSSTKTGIFMDKGNDSEGSSRKTALFMDKEDDSEGLSIKTAHFMDKRDDSEGSSIKTAHFMDKGNDSEGSSIKTAHFMDKGDDSEGSSIKTAHFMDKGNDSEGSSIKTALFMDKRDDSEGSSIKTALFMDKGDDSEGLSIKTGLFMDKGDDSEGSSIKTGLFMDKADDSEGSSIKTGLFMDKGDDSEGSSIKTAHFMDKRARLTVSGLEAVTVDIRQSNFTNVGERTNVAGSRKFARLISEGKYDEALQIAARQIEDGATIIDINMDDAMLDSTREMERFVRHISNDPAVAKAALMIDSSHWETIEAGLKNAQGKCIVNSISLKEGPEQFIEKAKAIRSLGAAVVIMAFDEKGQATTFDRKIEICSRAYRILTEEAGLSPENIIFDANILSIGTGIEEHSKYAIDFIEAVRWIKTNLPGALTSGGVSNLSFSFRGNNAVREAMHSAFLYHAVKAGLDMAIVNPSMLQIYDEIEPELLRCVEDVIFDRDPQATERLIDKAARMMAEKETGNQNSTGKAELKESAAHTETGLTPGERLKAALIKGRSETLAEDLEQALYIYGNAVDIIEGPLMEGMETVGKMFGEGKMFLPQVVKSAKVMRDAVEILQPYMDTETAQSGNSKAESGAPHIEAPDSTAESDGSHIEAADSDAESSSSRIEAADSISGSDRRKAKPKITLATVKGDVHDIGKNITGIVLTCNGFQVNDLGVMVDKETILRASDEDCSDIIAVSGLITPSLYQMEELCREMAERNMTKPLFVGGATTSALHTAVKLAPLYGHVFHGPDASSAAVMAKKYMMDPTGFEAEEHKKQDEIRKLYHKQEDTPQEYNMEDNSPKGFGYETYPDGCPTDIPAQQIPSEEVLQYFDWKMFYAIWGVKYGSSSMEAMELVQLRRDAEEEIALGNFRIMLSARFFPAYTENDDIVLVNGRNSAEAGLDSHGGNRTGSEWKRIPMMRQEKGDRRSLCDYIIAKESGRTSPLGCFAISVHAADAHEEGCCCPACSNKYEDLIGKAVRMTLAEAASTWLDKKILQQMQQDVTATDGCSRNSDETVTSKVPLKVIKPAAGYSSCPDHSLKRDILELLGETTVSHHSHGPHCTCGCHHDEHTHDHSHTEGHGHNHTESHGHGQETGALKIRLTETCAMTPEASICGTIFIHPEARYPEIRSISQEQHDSYIARRGMNEDTARRFLSHLLK